ncbi:hypothetical protein E2C01_081941 [Portunus trituberculatus]|uniref:Uncharacterized protein n=1 Tax=Portunus trituberculatus TaxID=210409 RepID=A0A5B7IR35_PORTR|nr:hypothetical protein [Portunus trituberculatus]
MTQLTMTTPPQHHHKQMGTLHFFPRDVFLTLQSSQKDTDSFTSMCLHASHAPSTPPPNLAHSLPFHPTTKDKREKKE